MVGRSEIVEGAQLSDLLTVGLCNVETPRLLIELGGELVGVRTTTIVEKGGKRTLVLTPDQS